MYGVWLALTCMLHIMCCALISEKKNETLTIILHFVTYILGCVGVWWFFKE